MIFYYLMSKDMISSDITTYRVSACIHASCAVYKLRGRHSHQRQVCTFTTTCGQRGVECLVLRKPFHSIMTIAQHLEIKYLKKMHLFSNLQKETE